MTEKRFEIMASGMVWDNHINEDRQLSRDEVVDLLNEQHEQIEDLKDANVRCCNEYSYFHKRMMELEKENEQLKKENQRMTDKLNELALEFLNYDMVTMGKATEISEMCYYDFLKYRKDNGNPMVLQL